MSPAMSDVNSHAKNGYLNFAAIVDFCIRRAWLVVLASVLILAGSSLYVARHFAVNTNVTNLLSPAQKISICFHGSGI